MAFAEIAAGLQLAGGVASIIGGNKAAKEAKEIARENAALTFSQRMEEMRRQQLEDAMIYGDAVARAYGSNVQAGQGSTATYLQQIQAEQSRQQAYSLQQAQRERDFTIKSGQTPGLDTARLGSAASTLASTVGTYWSLTR